MHTSSQGYEVRKIRAIDQDLGRPRGIGYTIISGEFHDHTDQTVITKHTCLADHQSHSSVQVCSVQTYITGSVVYPHALGTIWQTQFTTDLPQIISWLICNKSILSFYIKTTFLEALLNLNILILQALLNLNTWTEISCVYQTLQPNICFFFPVHNFNVYGKSHANSTQTHAGLLGTSPSKTGQSTPASLTACLSNCQFLLHQSTQTHMHIKCLCCTMGVCVPVWMCGCIRTVPHHYWNSSESLCSLSKVFGEKKKEQIFHTNQDFSSGLCQYSSKLSPC